MISNLCDSFTHASFQTHREGRASAVPVRIPPWSGGGGGGKGRCGWGKLRWMRTLPSMLRRRGATAPGGSASVRKSVSDTAR